MSKNGNPIAGQIGHGGTLNVKATHVKNDGGGKTTIKAGSDLRDKGGK